MEKEKGRWITIRGNHIFIKDGQTVEEAFNEFLDNNPEAELESKDYESELEESYIIKGRYDLDEYTTNKELEKDYTIKTEKPNHELPDNDLLMGELGFKKNESLIYNYYESKKGCNILEPQLNPLQHGNCQNCVLAYYLRMTCGWDVTAMPFTPGSLNELYDMFENANPVKHFSDAYIYTEAEFRKMMFNDCIKAGEGSIFFVTIGKWKGANNGHIFIVQNINGKPVVIEPQNWRTPTKRAHNYFWEMSTNYGISWMRVDDKTLKQNNDTVNKLSKRILSLQNMR